MSERHSDARESVSLTNENEMKMEKIIDLFKRYAKDDTLSFKYKEGNCPNERTIEGLKENSIVQILKITKSCNENNDSKVYDFLFIVDWKEYELSWVIFLNKFWKSIKGISNIDHLKVNNIPKTQDTVRVKIEKATKKQA